MCTSGSNQVCTYVYLWFELSVYVCVPLVRAECVCMCTSGPN